VILLKVSDKLDGIAISEIRKMNALAGAETLNLGIGQLPNSLPKAVESAGVDAFNKGFTRYSANAGFNQLRELIAQKFVEDTGREVSAESVVVTNGAEGALWNILYTFLDSGDEVLIPEIGFSVYETITKMQGATPVEYKLEKNFELDFADIKSKINSKTKFIVLNSPNNPTGKLYRAEEIQQLVHIAEEKNIYIISDEIYGKLYFDNSKPESPAKYSEYVIVVDGISKQASATGLRIGWTVASKEITDSMIISNQYIATCASTPSQMAAIPVLRGMCDSFISDVRKSLEENRDIAFKMLSEIDGVEVTKPEGAFYIFPNISKFGKSKDVALNILKQVDVLTIPGIAFGKRGDNHIRISYACDKDLLIEGLGKIAKVLRSY
jgi:aspartate aminotransferase